MERRVAVSVPPVHAQAVCSGKQQLQDGRGRGVGSEMEERSAFVVDGECGQLGMASKESRERAVGHSELSRTDAVRDDNHSPGVSLQHASHSLVLVQLHAVCF